MTVACDIIIRNFPINIVYDAFFAHSQNINNRNVSALLFVCAVLNYDADSSFYIIFVVLYHLNDIFIISK